MTYVLEHPRGDLVVLGTLRSESDVNADHELQGIVLAIDNVLLRDAVLVCTEFVFI